MSGGLTIKDRERKILWYKYYILRRMLCYTNHNLEHIKRVCYELEGKPLIELSDIHKREIGY